AKTRRGPFEASSEEQAASASTPPSAAASAATKRFLWRRVLPAVVRRAVPRARPCPVLRGAGRMIMDLILGEPLDGSALSASEPRARADHIRHIHQAEAVQIELRLPRQHPQPLLQPQPQ